MRMGILISGYGMKYAWEKDGNREEQNYNSSSTSLMGCFINFTPLHEAGSSSLGVGCEQGIVIYLSIYTYIIFLGFAFAQIGFVAV